MLRGKQRVLIAEDCFPSVHFLLTGLASKTDFVLDTVPKREDASWVEAEDFLAAWDPDFLLTATDVKAWEAQHGEIEHGTDSPIRALALVPVG